MPVGRAEARCKRGAMAGSGRRARCARTAGQCKDEGDEGGKRALKRVRGLKPIRGLKAVRGANVGGGRRAPTACERPSPGARGGRLCAWAAGRGPRWSGHGGYRCLAPTSRARGGHGRGGATHGAILRRPGAPPPAANGRCRRLRRRCFGAGGRHGCAGVRHGSTPRRRPRTDCRCLSPAVAPITAQTASNRTRHAAQRPVNPSCPARNAPLR